MVADREVVVSVGNKAGAQEQGELLQGCYVFYEKLYCSCFERLIGQQMAPYCRRTIADHLSSTTTFPFIGDKKKEPQMLTMSLFCEHQPSLGECEGESYKETRTYGQDEANVLVGQHG
jgi:hypothetical protein